MSVIKHLSPLAAFVKSPEVGTRTCESLPFKLQCYVTTAILMGSSIFLGAKELIGTPIDCMSSLPKKVINNYCWVSSTFTMDDYSQREMGTMAVAPAVYSPDDYDDETMRSKWTFHNYYQWVVAVLFLSAGLSFLPKLIWIWSEGNVIPILTKNLTQNIYRESDIVKRKKEVINYFLSHLRMHNVYFFSYLFCEVLCFLIVGTQVFYLNKFLGGAFFDYGYQVMNFTEKDQADRVDPMIYIFPRQTKCIFYIFGPSGTIERRDAFCLLPQNIVNEKVFILLWFWLMILFVLLAVLLIYRCIIMSMAVIRVRILRIHAKYVPKEVLETLIEKGTIGDWWIFYQLTSKIDPVIYKDILTNVAMELELRGNSNSCEELNQNSNGYIANGGGYNGHSRTHGYYPKVNKQLASAPPVGFAQSSV